MQFLTRFLLPGTGFRVWLAIVAAFATFAGFAYSQGMDEGPFTVLLTLWPLVALFALASLIPIGLALWVSVRQVRLGLLQSAAAYGAVPIVALIMAALCSGTAYRATEWTRTQVRLSRASAAIDEARKAGQVVSTEDRWIDPGPPTRAKLLQPSWVFVRFFIIYAEDTDMEWLEEQVRECRASRTAKLARNFYFMAGQCPTAPGSLPAQRWPGVQN